MNQFLKTLENPFLNLTFKQKILLTVRIWFPLLALIFNIVLLCVKNDPLSCYIARINCDHVDLAKGLSEILNGGTDVYSLVKPNVDLPFYVDLTSPQSELNIIRDFARHEVETAPQYFLLGYNQYCTVQYETDYDLNKQLYLNLSLSCQDYDEINPLDYITILNKNGFEAILTFAKIVQSTPDSFDRLLQLRVYRIVYIIEFVLLPLSFLSSLYVYCCRQGKKDLSAISTWKLHIPLVLSVFAGVAEICSFSIIFYNLGVERQQIQKTLDKFGINMVYGQIFMGLMIAIFVLTTLAMVFWVIPMYCANPPDVDDTDEIHVVTTSTPRLLKARMLSKMSNGLLRRKPKPYTESRSESPLVVKLLLIDPSEVDFSADPFTTSQRIQSERELRKLGDELANRPDVRKSAKSPLKLL